MSLHVLYDTYPQLPSLPRALETGVRKSSPSLVGSLATPQLPSASMGRGTKERQGRKSTLYTSKSYSAKLKNALVEFSWDLIRMASGEKGLDGTHCCDLDSASQSPGVSLWKWHEVPVCHRDSVKRTRFVNSSVHPPRNKSHGGEKK